jgi:hypothetical protein
VKEPRLLRNLLERLKMKIKTHELTGPALDWAVQKVLFARQDYVKPWVLERHAAGDPCGSASTDWSQGGQLVEEGIDLFIVRDREGQGVRWVAYIDNSETSYGYFSADGPTPLVAAMRCIVLAELGEDVELPKELEINQKG